MGGPDRRRQRAPEPARVRAAARGRLRDLGRRAHRRVHDDGHLQLRAGRHRHVHGVRVLGAPREPAPADGRGARPRRVRRRAASRARTRPGDHAPAPAAGARRPAHGDRRAHAQLHGYRGNRLGPEHDAHDPDTLRDGWLPHRRRDPELAPVHDDRRGARTRGRPAVPALQHPARCRDARRRRQPRPRGARRRAPRRRFELLVGARLLAGRDRRHPDRARHRDGRHRIAVTDRDQRLRRRDRRPPAQPADDLRRRAAPRTRDPVLAAVPEPRATLVASPARPPDDHAVRGAAAPATGQAPVQPYQRSATHRTSLIGAGHRDRHDRARARDVGGVPQRFEPDEHQPLDCRHGDRAHRAVARAAHRLGRSGLARTTRVRRLRRRRLREVGRGARQPPRGRDGHARVHPDRCRHGGAGPATPRLVPRARNPGLRVDGRVRHLHAARVARLAIDLRRTAAPLRARLRGPPRLPRAHHRSLRARQHWRRRARDAAPSGAGSSRCATPKRRRRRSG